MFSNKLLWFFFPFLMLCGEVSSQFEFPFNDVSSCTSGLFFNTANQRCEGCPTNGSSPTTDSLECACSAAYKRVISSSGDFVFECEQCPVGSVPSTDGTECIACSGTSPSIDGDRCLCPLPSQSLVERSSDGSILSSATCVNCTGSTGPSSSGSCSFCATCDPSLCQCSQCLTDGVCLGYAVTTNVITNDPTSYVELKAPAAFGGCRAVVSPNITACQALSNMCVMQLYDLNEPACELYEDIFNFRGTGTINSNPAWKMNLPWIYYDELGATSPSANSPLSSTSVTTSFTFGGANGIIDFIVMRYDANGTYLGQEGASSGLLQVCPDRPSIKSAAFVFGTTYLSSCQLSAATLSDRSLYPAEFYEINLNFTDDSGVMQLFPLPVIITNLNQGVTADESFLVKRFFLVDSLSQEAGAGIVRYASAMSIWITLQTPSDSGRINPPYLRITYSTIDSTTPEALSPASFSVNYFASTASRDRAFLISLLVLGFLGLLYALFEIGWWRRRQGLLFFEGSSLLMFLYYGMSMLANVFFVVMFGYSVITLFFFKAQSTVTTLLPNADQSQIFVIMTSLAFAFKCIEVLGMIGIQSSPDIFLIDWERSRDNEGKTSIWRTYFIANEWNEIQTHRKTNFTFQLFAVLLFLEVIGFKSLALENASGTLGQGSSGSADVYIPVYNSILRFGIGALVYSVIAFLQVIYQLLIHERFIQDKIREFVDLCSVSNISILILSNKQHGYYIHGRSVHGRADTDMMDMNLMLKKEEEDLTGGRGLETGSDLQTFQCSIPIKFRVQFDKIYQPLELVRSQPAARGGNTPLDSVMNESVRAYTTMRKFLTSFLDHSIRDLDYFVKDKVFLERLLDMEFQEPVESAYFYNDRDNSFTSILFYGREFALVTFDILLFTIIDYNIHDYLLAAIITFIVGKFLSYLRQSLGRRNLAKKTLVDQRFLI